MKFEKKKRSDYSLFSAPPFCCPSFQPPTQQTHEEMTEEVCWRPVSLRLTLARMSNTTPLVPCCQSTVQEYTTALLEARDKFLNTVKLRLETVMRHVAFLPPTKDAVCHMGVKCNKISWECVREWVSGTVHRQCQLWWLSKKAPPAFHCVVLRIPDALHYFRWQHNVTSVLLHW